MEFSYGGDYSVKIDRVNKAEVRRAEQIIQAFAKAAASGARLRDYITGVVD